MERNLKTKKGLDILLGTQVLIYWEEGLFSWFPVILKKIDPNNGMTTIYYPESDEIERDVNIFNLIKKQWILIKEEETPNNKRDCIKKKILDSLVFDNSIPHLIQSKSSLNKHNLTVNNSSRRKFQKNHSLYYQKSSNYIKRTFKLSNSRHTVFKEL